MLEQYFDSPLRLQALHNGPSAALLEGFAQERSHWGYAKITARRHIRDAEHFVYWTDKAGIAAADFNEQVIVRFDNHLRHCQCVGYSCKRRDLLHSVHSFVRYVCGAGLNAGPAAATAAEDPVLLSFCEWMRAQRGTSDRTLRNYIIPLRDLLKCMGDDLARLDAQGLRDFVLSQSQRGCAKTCIKALRMFVRFLIAEGQCTADLAAAIPAVASWRLSSLPRYLQSEDVERVIASCSQSSPAGKRNRAILLLLARLGLRAGDIVQLRLGDIDWKGGWICVSGKSKRQTQLPVTQEVGEAIVDYLQHARPQSNTDAVFVRCCAPFRGFTSHIAISMIVKRAMRCAGVMCASRGAAHVLRHSAASSMLRQGASLQDIAAILRHRSIETTQIYAKVDVSALRRIAQPWPEVRPC